MSIPEEVVVLSPPPPLLGGVMKNVTGQILNWIVEEVAKKDVVNAKLKDNFVLPIFRIIQDQMMPYALFIMIFAVFLFILSITNLMFSMMVYFRRS